MNWVGRTQLLVGAPPLKFGHNPTSSFIGGHDDKSAGIAPLSHPFMKSAWNPKPVLSPLEKTKVFGLTLAAMVESSWEWVRET